MAQSALLTNQTTDIDGAQATVTGPCTITVEDASVFAGASVTIQANVGGTGWTNTPVVFSQSGQKNLHFLGSYDVRAVQRNSGDSTDITCHSNQ